MIRARAARAAQMRKCESRVSVPLSHPSHASPLRAIRGRPLQGRFRPPGDKSISHRAFIFGLLTCGETMVEGLARGRRRLGTGAACKALGGAIERLGPGRWRIRGPGLGAPLRRARCSTLATPERLAPDDGVVGSHGTTATFDGDASLRKRPMAAFSIRCA